MTPIEPVETVRQIYAAFWRGDISAILGALHPDILWEHDAVDHGIPWLRPRHGRDQVTGFFDALGALETQRFAPLNLLAGGSQVAAVIEAELTVRATGRTIRDLELHLWTFDNAGRVTHFRHLADTLRHWQAVQA